MKLNSILVIGGGIGGLTVAIALRRKGFPVRLIEKDSSWTAYGVGIIQQFNVIRAMDSLDLLDAYLAKAHGFDLTTLHAPSGDVVASFDTPRLAGPEYPSNAGIQRTDLQHVLAERAAELGTDIRFGLTADEFKDDGGTVEVTFSDNTTEHFDMVIGADGVYSQTRGMIMPNSPKPRYTGQWVWRYNLPMPTDMKGIEVYNGPVNAGLVPIGNGLMYMFLLSQEEPDFRLADTGAAEVMRSRAAGAAPQILAHAENIVDDAGVVGRPLEVIFLEDAWHLGRIVLLGDAIHGATPHLAQGAGMAIEDALVLAEELTNGDNLEIIFTDYHARRLPRVEFVAKNSIAIGDAQMGKIASVDVAKINGDCIGLMAQPI